MSATCSNVRVPYELRDQPVPIEDVILHLGFDLRSSRLMQFETQSRLSDASGVSQGTWSMVENGLAEGVRLEVLARMAAALHLDLVFRPCNHPPGAGRRPPNGRTRRTASAPVCADSLQVSDPTFPQRRLDWDEPVDRTTDEAAAPQP